METCVCVFKKFETEQDFLIPQPFSTVNDAL